MLPVNPLIIEVPSRLGLRPGGVAAAPCALRKAGLHARLGPAGEARIDVPPYCNVRDPETGLLNPRGTHAIASRPWKQRVVGDFGSQLHGQACALFIDGKRAGLPSPGDDLAGLMF